MSDCTCTPALPLDPPTAHEESCPVWRRHQNPRLWTPPAREHGPEPNRPTDAPMHPLFDPRVQEPE